MSTFVDAAMFCHWEFGPGTKFPGESGPEDRIPRFSATEIMVRPWGN